MKRWISTTLALLAGVGLTSTGLASGTGRTVELNVAGAPVSATETEKPRSFDEPALPEGFPEGSGGGILAQYWSALGREDRSAELDPREYQATACEALPGGPSGTSAVLDAIVAQAQDTRVVIINESHVNTLHRDFSRQIIERLRPLGFTVFAAEAFRNVDGAPDPIEVSSDLDYPLRSDGSYTEEPVFGSLVRSAKHLGFRLAAYEIARVPGSGPIPEDLDQSIAEREQAQAENLKALLASMPAEEKLIVHVGYWHAREIEDLRSDGFDISMMAARFARLTGINPLTIAQTECSGGGPVVRLSIPPQRIQGAFDMIVDHPADGFRYGRAAWRFENGATEVIIPEELRPIDRPLIIEAFAEGEPFYAVPIDRVWIDPGEDVRLALRPGRYTVRAVRPTLAADSPTTP